MSGDSMECPVISYALYICVCVSVSVNRFHGGLMEVVFLVA